MADEDNVKKIVVKKDGPYEVHGNIPLVHKTQIVSEYGEPLTWQKLETIPTDGTYYLCRCGSSNEKPFCSADHRKTVFDGTEKAPITESSTRQDVIPGQNIILKRDYRLCMESGFCGNRVTDVGKMIHKTDDTIVRAQLIAMIERCPSGSLAYSIDANSADIEPDLPEQIAVTTEITSYGPIDGPLWVTGNIPIERADGQPFETRNRVTLCNCGMSKLKPLCDGTHREEAERKAHGHLVTGSS
ncbi:MAG: CDGSH iron-sulfur domain-containing protein [Anaerolineaceae bacterium]|nr:CDGSH iron-sulfur domain-containing protein [Anaerolineaceae bacterium]